MISISKPCFFIAISFLLTISVSAQNIKILQQGRLTSIRGLSVVNNKVAWASGSKGNVALTIDGGKTWTWQQVKGYEKSDFRDIEAFSDKEAIIMASGTPALILKTNDGGLNWKLVYRNDNEVFFLDAMDFSDSKNGYILGDPINGKFLLLKTTDAGSTWTDDKDAAPEALVGEAAFAASGTCLRIEAGIIYIVTGGNKSRLITIQGNNQHIINLPIIQGQPGQGAFSVAVGSRSSLIIIGGDYTNDKKTDSVACIAYAKGVILADKGPAGYQSCVEYINRSIFLSTGTPGSNITIDGGKTWRQIDTTSFNVCRKAKRGNLILLAGNNGKIAVFTQ